MHTTALVHLLAVACAQLACSTAPTAPTARALMAPDERFTRAEDAWSDGATGLAWPDPLPGIYTRDEAARACEARRATLPTVEQLKDVEAGGLMALAPETWTGAWYWTSSASPVVFMGMLARSYQGLPHGYVVNLATDDRISARCVRPRD